MIPAVPSAPERNIVVPRYMRDGDEHSVSPKLVILAAGAVQSAALLLRSANDAFPRGDRKSVV